ncbi:hypothetical protein OH492_13415 [Vibrio chagasii]|nr:hypothetical protein [Vibrio chagasii]
MPSKEQLFALRDASFSRNVIVQVSCHSTDNRALVDALETAGELAQGTAFVDERPSQTKSYKRWTKLAFVAFALTSVAFG